MAPDVQPARPKCRSVKPAGPWVAARKTVQYLALLVFIVFFVASRWGGWPASLVNIPMRLDPLLVISHLLASRVFLASSALALLTLILTLVFGRAWCGWLCPLGTILDLFSLASWRNTVLPSTAKNPSPVWRSVKYAILIAILVAALFGNLTLLFLDPLTILFRTLTVSLWPAFDQIILALEKALYPISALSGPISTIDSWLRPAVLPVEPTYYRDALLFAALFAAIILLNLTAPRFWCRYLCPLGAFLGLISKLAIFRRSVGEECKGCTLCTQVCPTRTIDPEQGYASDPAECTMCLDCLETCPRSSIVFTPTISLARWQTYDPGRRQALAAFGLTLAALAILRSDAAARREHPHWLRPPGAHENDFTSKCVRCAECMRACPTSALQPTATEAGTEGLWTPVLIPRLGYCDYSCNACGQVCPVQAIPPLNLEEKRTQVIGKAYINTHRCIAWADHTDCIVCEEMCPLSEKAIYLKSTTFEQRDGTTTKVQLPYVDRDLCIGCGICEYKCPLQGEAAIRVYVTT